MPCGHYKEMLMMFMWKFDQSQSRIWMPEPRGSFAQWFCRQFIIVHTCKPHINHKGPFIIYDWGCAGKKRGWVMTVKGGGGGGT